MKEAKNLMDINIRKVLEQIEAKYGLKLPPESGNCRLWRGHW